MRVLCIDAEGGRGGSSRSLFYTLTNMKLDKNDNLEVWHRLPGKLLKKYKHHNIKTKHIPNLVKFWPTERFLVNCYLYLRCVYKWYFLSHSFKKELFYKLKTTDILHCNIETLHFVIAWARKNFPDLKIVCHVRTTPSKSIFFTLQANVLIEDCNHIIFITPNEKNIFEYNSKKIIKNSSIIFNPPSIHRKKYNRKIKKKIKIICVSNFAYVKGVDLVIDVAKQTKIKNLSNIINFSIVGTYSENGPFYKIKSFFNPRLDPIKYASKSGVNDYVNFIGQVSNPEHFIDRSDFLIKLTRENNPWGRDIIEAMSMGIPTISVGDYSGFVKTDSTGLLLQKYNASKIIDWLYKVYDNPKMYSRMSILASETIYNICDPVKIANELKVVWEKLYKLS